MTEHVTWESCPACHRPAAVGWLDDVPLEFDCPAGCRLTDAQVRAFADKRRSPAEWLNRY